MSPNLPEQFQSYKPKVSFKIDSQDFIVKIAETEQELISTFQLRHSVFYQEKMDKTLPGGLDIDEYDSIADHLIVVQKSTKKIVGTYRMIATKFHSRFYNSEFFTIQDFLNKKEGNKVEVGRACTDKSFRKRGGSQVIHHIWLGLARYFKKTHSRYMFGSVSIMNSSVEYAASIYKSLLEKKIIDTQTPVQCIGKYKIKDFDKLVLKSQANQKNFLKLPRLFIWYIAIGAKMHGLPIYDPELNSYDFFTSLDFKNITNPRLINRYEDAASLRDILQDQ